jgi:uncharacterized protein
MPSRFRTSALLALLALLLLVPASAAAVERTVSVSGNETLKVANDTAGLSFSVSKERRSRGAALRAVSSRLRAVIAAVQGIRGVGPGDVTTGRISVGRSFRGTRPLYRASEGISVVLHEPAEAGSLVSSAIRAGATGTNGPRFFVGDPEAAYRSALAAAFEEAKARASALAVQAGATLGPVLSITEGGEVEEPPFTTSAPAKGADCATFAPTTTVAVSKRCTGAPPPVKPGESTVTATVRVVFALL